MLFGAYAVKVIKGLPKAFLRNTRARTGEPHANPKSRVSI